MSAPAPKDVDEYIATAPEAARPLLVQLRQAILAAAPGAVERISYGMPHYELNGRITYIAGYRRHVAMYVVGDEKERFAERLKPYMTMKSTARFEIGRALPVDLVTDIVRSRVRANQARAGATS